MDKYKKLKLEYLIFIIIAMGLLTITTIYTIKHPEPTKKIVEKEKK